MKKLRFFCLIIAAIVSSFYQIGLAKEVPTAQDCLQKGMEFETQGIYEEAIKMYTQAITLDNSNANAYFKRGKAYRVYHKTHPTEALADFNKSIELDPTNAEAYYQRGMLHLFTIDNENGRKDMRTAAGLGHKEAQKWLAPDREEKSKEKKSPSMRTAALPGRSGEQKSLPAERVEKEGKDLNLAKYLSSGSEPVIYFDFNMSNIKQQYHAILDEIALILKEKMPGANLLLAGHTDSTGTERYNENLSLRRAKAVEAYLKGKHKIPSGRLITKGFGENAPIAANETAEGRAKNRRVEMRTQGE